MSFKRFVEVGRVGLITYGPDTGKLCTIVNVIDNNRVLVDGPETLTGVHRHALNIKRIQLTDITIGAKLNASTKCAPTGARSSSPVPASRARAARTPGTGQREGTGPARPRAMHVAIAGRHSTRSSAPSPRRQLKGLWESEGVAAKFAATSQSKKRSARALRASSTDFDRFKIQIAKKERAGKRAKA